MLRFPPLGVAACLVAGAGLWLTRASMDVAATGAGEVRVAMFPSWVELAALMVLSMVVALLLSRIVQRIWRRRLHWAAALPVDPLLPLFSLIWLAVPYLPSLPDEVPALRALAGPARYGLWMVVAGQALWILSDLAARARGERESPRRPQLTRSTWLILLIGIASCAAAWAALSGGVIYPSTDEAHYLAAVLAAAAAAIAWRWSAQSCGSGRSATFAWVAVAASAPFLLHAPAARPEIAAAVITVGVLAWTPPAALGRGAALAAQGLAIGALPWLAPAFAPLWLALTIIVAARQRRVGHAALAALPSIASFMSAVTIHREVWGSASLEVLRAHAAEPGALALGIVAAFADQEFGLLPYAPALVLAIPGLLVMWRQRGVVRRQAIEAGATAATVIVTAAGSAWAARGAPPAAHAFVMLPLLLLPIAWWDRDAAMDAVRRSAGRALALAGVAISVALVGVNAGALAANRADGSSRFLEWLAPSRDLVRLVPSFVAQREMPGTIVLLLALWAAGALAAAAVLGRLRVVRQGSAAPLAVSSLLATMAVVAVAAPLTLDGTLARRVAPAERSESALLRSFDARARPSAVAYDRWRRVSPETVPALFVFEGRPGLRREPQPLRVLMNTRLALPAGDYEVELQPGRDEPLEGPLGLQIGRTGPPVRNWPVHARNGEPWRHRFRLDVDAPFVGFRAPEAIERAVDRLRVRPLSVLNTAERLDRHLDLPPVLAAARYREVTAYFHGTGAWPEANGFWVRGGSGLLITIVRDPEAEGPDAVRLRVHSGAAANRVQLEAGTWRAAAELEPGREALVDVPLLQRGRKTALRITTETGFVPAETNGGSDRRLLGCWVEVVE